MSVYWDEHGLGGQVEYPAWLRRLIGKYLCWRGKHKWYGGWSMNSAGAKAHLRCGRRDCNAANNKYYPARNGVYVTEE